MLGNPLQGNKPVNISSAACITKAVWVSPLECPIVTLMSSCKTIIHVNYVDWFYKAILELQLPVSNLKVDSCNKTQRKKLRSQECYLYSFYYNSKDFMRAVFVLFKKIHVHISIPFSQFFKFVSLPIPQEIPVSIFIYTFKDPGRLKTYPLPYTPTPNLVHWQFTVMYFSLGCVFRKFSEPRHPSLQCC